MLLTPFDLASRYVGIREISGGLDHPLVQWWLSLCFDGKLDLPDETPWCSAFMNGIAWELRLPRSKSAAARSWLGVGRAVSLADAKVGADVVILNRGGPDVGPVGPGHVGWYAGPGMLLAGNQNNAVSVAPFDASKVLGVRRLMDA